MTGVATSHPLALVYFVYVAASIGLTFWLARTLFASGAVFLEDVFVDNPRLAAAVNRLLVVGFYLLNLGYAFVMIRVGRYELTGIEAMETLSVKLGSLMLVLGVVHFANLYVFHRIRRRSQIRLAPPPVRPQLRRSEPNGAAVHAEA